MRTGHHKTAHYASNYQRDAFVGVVESVLSRLRVDTESLALYLAVVTLWGIIIYAAQAYALP